jgi:hypothetical protein
VGGISDSSDDGGLTLFAQAAAEVVRHVQAATGFPACMVGQVVGHRWLVVAAEDPAGDLTVGDRLRWAASISSRVLVDGGPVVLSEPAEDPRASSAPVVEDREIGSWFGAPLRLPDGRLFAVLCGVHPEPGAAARVDESLLVLCAGLLERVVQLESAWGLQERRAARAERALGEDVPSAAPVVKLPRWSRALAHEDERCARYGHGASVLTVRRRAGPRREGAPELDMLDVAARTRQLLRLTDVVAAVGPREVAVLLAETRPEGARQAAARILAGLGDHARDLAFGLAHRERTGLVGAWSASRLAAAGGPGGVVRELDGPSPAADRASAAHVPRAVVATPC